MRKYELNLDLLGSEYISELCSQKTFVLDARYILGGNYYVLFVFFSFYKWFNETVTAVTTHKQVTTWTMNSKIYNTQYRERQERFLIYLFMLNLQELYTQ